MILIQVFFISEFFLEGMLIFFFYLGFKSKKIRVNLNLPIKSETKAETTEVLKLVDEDRKYVSQATIVRCVF